MKLFNKIAYHSTKQKNLTQFEDTTSDDKAFKGEGVMVHGWGLYLQADKELNVRRYKDSLGLSSYKGIITIDDKTYWFDDKHLNNDGSCILFDSNNNVIDSEYFFSFISDCYNLGGEQAVKKLKRTIEIRKSFYEKNVESESKEYGKDEIEDTTNEVRNYITDELRNYESVYDEVKDAKITVKREEVNSSQYAVEIPDDFKFMHEEGLMSEELVDKMVNEFGFYTDVQFKKDGEELQKIMIEKFPELSPDTFAPYPMKGPYQRRDDEVMEWILECNSSKFGLNIQHNYFDIVEKLFYTESDEYKKYHVVYEAMRFFTDQRVYERVTGRDTSVKFANWFNTEYFANRDNVVGEDFYNDLVKATGSPKKASEWLYQNGIDGIEYVGDTDGLCYVIFNCKDLKIIGEE